MIPSSGASTSIVALSVSWEGESASARVCQHSGRTRVRGRRTISSRTSPAMNVSPGCFFHAAIPPSVIVGDMAGICSVVTARRAADACIPALRA